MAIKLDTEVTLNLKLTKDKIEDGGRILDCYNVSDGEQLYSVAVWNDGSCGYLTNLFISNSCFYHDIIKGYFNIR